MVDALTSLHVVAHEARQPAVHHHMVQVHVLGEGAVGASLRDVREQVEGAVLLAVPGHALSGRVRHTAQQLHRVDAQTGTVRSKKAELTRRGAGHGAARLPAGWRRAAR